MRLIDTTTLEIQEFPQNRIPEYAILSHVWIENEEVLFSEFSLLNIRQKRGWNKITECCRQAVKDGCRYAWIDTCCIDKSSSAELSEAINSMYVWYKRAVVCYAYLHDVPSRLVLGNDDSQAFGQSRWFTRGWTLQELLAPARVEFFNREWESLGTKDSLRMRIKTVTGIPVVFLTGQREVESASVGQRMSWASSRETTREEDLAYCLMGIFEVNMPMLYGEGGKSFIRLQEAIMSITDDQSLFAWADVDGSPDKHRGLLADHPKHFKHSGKYIARPELDDDNVPISSTGKGVWLNTFFHPSDANNAVAILKCTEGNEANSFATLRLVRFGPSKSNFARIDAHKLEKKTLGGTQRSIYVPKNPRPNISPAIKQRYFCIVFPTSAFNATIDKFSAGQDCVILPASSYTRRTVKDDVPHGVYYIEPLKEIKPEFNSGTFVGGEMFLNGNPTDYIYSLPLRPSTRVLTFVLETSFKHFLIRLGLDEEGQIGWDIRVNSVGIPFVTEDIHKQFEPEQSPSNSFFQVDQEWYQVSVVAPSLDRLEVGEIAVVELQICNCRLTDGSGRYSTVAPVQQQQESGVVETGHRHHGLNTKFGNFSKERLVSVMTAGLMK